MPKLRKGTIDGERDVTRRQARVAVGEIEELAVCGRFTLRTDREIIARHFGLDLDQRPLVARYNIAPTQEIAALRGCVSGPWQLVALRWGLIPIWATDPAIGNRLVNARAETLATKPAFRVALRKRRCLILADGFYEWQALAGRKTKQPYYLRMKDDQPFAFAGLWEHWLHEGEEIESCTIVTTQANDLMQPIHHRMPVIVAPADYARWLDPDIQVAQRIQDLLTPYPSEALCAFPVSTRVNHARNDQPECIELLEVS